MADVQPLLSDGHIAAVVTAIAAGFGAVAAAVRWGIGRFAKGLDDLTAAVTKLCDKTEAADRSLVKLEGTVNEGRTDARETRDIVVDRLPAPDRFEDSRERPRPPASSRRSNPAIPAVGRRANTESEG